MQKIGVLGAGTMGAGIAQTFAAAGLNVVLRDVSEDLVSGGLNIVKKNLDRQVAKGTLPEIEHQAILGRIQAATDLTRLQIAIWLLKPLLKVWTLRKSFFLSLMRSANQQPYLFRIPPRCRSRKLPVRPIARIK